MRVVLDYFELIVWISVMPKPRGHKNPYAKAISYEVVETIAMEICGKV